MWAFFLNDLKLNLRILEKAVTNNVYDVQSGYAPDRRIHETVGGN